MISLICAIEKSGTDELICRAEVRVPDAENNAQTPGWASGRGMSWETGLTRVHY